MVKRRTGTRLAATTFALVAMATAITGCGSDDAPTANGPTTSSASAGTTSTKNERPASPRSVEEDTELAEKARLEPADLPGTWTQPTDGSTPPLSSNSDDFTCADPPPDFELIRDTSSRPQARTPLLSETGTSRRITEAVEVLASVDEANRYMAVLRDPKFHTCVTERMNAMMKELGKPGKDAPGTIAVDATAAGAAGSSDATGYIETIEVPPAGDEVIGFEAAVFLEANSGQKPTYSVYVRIDRIVAVVGIEGDTAPTPDEMHVFAAAAETKVRKTLEDF